MRLTKKRKRIFNRTLSAFMVACILFSTFSSSITTFATSNENSQIEILKNEVSVDSGDAVLSDQKTEDSKESLADDKSAVEEPTDGVDNSDATQKDECSDKNCSTEHAAIDGEETDSVKEENEEIDKDAVTEDGNLEEKEEDKEDFVVLGVIAPEKDIISADPDEEVTLTSKLNRNDVEVSYQWQKIYEETADNISSDALHDYSAGIPTAYSFVLDDTTEAEYLKKNPEATWPGIEMYLAIVNALDEIGEDSNNVSLEWNTKNFALDGYIISAAKVGDKVEIYADKDGQRYVGKLNKDGKWEFGDSEKYTVTWQDIDDATKDEYTFTVKESDYAAFYRCVVTILDEEYKAECLAFLEQQQNTPSEADKEAVQQIYSPSMKVEGVTVGVDEQTAATFSLKKRAMVGSPALSDDIQWVTGLTPSYEYITKETYDRVTKWLDAGKITKTQADRYWTRMTQNGFGGAAKANVLDENGFPVGGEDNIRLYNGFDLTDGMLEINSEWYGKTVYFRVHESGQKWKQTGTAIDVPAYTELTKDENGEYIESASGTRYKKAITILNPYVIDTGAKYKEYLEIGAITTTVSHSKGKGWLLDENRKVTDNHVTVYAVSCETFNNNPQQFMVDAEGNYRMDSIAWGVCTGEEPDISGKSYWALKDYIANGYGFLIGHDTMYAYAGAYYDAFGVDLDESSIDPNDGTTWYYDLNSWMPGTTASTYERDEAGNVVSVKATSETRGGHFYLNELIGSNAGNVNSDTVDLSDAPSGILSTGGSHGKYGKNIMYGGDQLQIVQTGFTAEQAVNNPIYRTPTNYPYKFSVGETFKSSLTHTNQQAAFGTIWANYCGGNILSQSAGAYEDAKIFEIGDAKGTNNFYLSGAGNFLMNQIGHLPSNSATVGEAKLFANSVFYTSQRKQCEICASGQGGHETVHFVHRINSANADEILNVLKDGGNYWYSLDDCYMLTDDISLPDDWEAIKNFSGHWNSDVYDVELNSKGTPLLENTDSPAGKYNETKPTDDNPDGWNLGEDRTVGTENVFKTDGSGIRTTGVARVVGDLNDLFETNTSYAGYKVKILGSDNPDYLEKDAEFVCIVNPDSKYVISNLPSIYDKSNPTGILKARVYDTKGNEVTEYGSIKAKVDADFWDNDMTTPLYLGSFAVDPVEDGKTYESAEFRFHATATSDDKPKAEKWQYRENDSSEWIDIQAEEGDFTSNISQTEAGDYHIKSELVLKDVNPGWDGHEYRCVFSSENHGQWSTYDYYLKGKVASLTDNGGTHKIVAKAGEKGTLTVKLWPARTSQGSDKKVYEGDSATFTSQAFVLDGDGKVDYKWQYSTKEWNSATGKYDTVWKDVEGSEEFGNTFEITKNAIKHINDGEDENSGFFTISQEYAEVTGNDGISEFNERAKFYQIDTSLKINKVDMKQNESQFRVKYIAESKFGTKYDIYSNVADNKNWEWINLSDDFEKSDNLGEKKVDNYSNTLLVNPPSLSVKMQEANKYSDSAQHIDVNDKIGQSLTLPNIDATVADGTATYRALIYYLPEQIKPEISWQYRTYKDNSAQKWSQDVAEELGYKDVKVSISNTPMGIEEIDGKTYNVIESTMAIDNVPLSMYNMEEYIKYFFRCVATSRYETSVEEKEITKVDTRDGYQWGGLTIDYKISINHNGVLGYGGKNSIANGYGSSFVPVENLEEIVEATKTSDRAYWKYPNLEIKAPEGQHINTVMVWFDEGYTHSDSDYINYDATKMSEYGIKTTEKNEQKIVFVSETKNGVSINNWNTFLREYVWFVTYDDIVYKDVTNVNSSISGGGRIKWYADELRIDGVTIDTSTGKAYKVITSSSAISWDNAKKAAEAYNSELGTNGYLAEISSSTENKIVSDLLGKNKAWLGGTRSSGSWKWANSQQAFNYTNWGDGAVVTNPYLTMVGDGTWQAIKGTSTTTQSLVYKDSLTWSNWTGQWILNNESSAKRPSYDGVRLVVGGKDSASNSVNLVKGHKYFINIYGGNYGDSNTALNVDFPAFNISVKPTDPETMTDISKIATFTGTSGNYSINVKCGVTGHNYTGLGTTVNQFDVIDLTAICGAGNEPDLEWCINNLSGISSKTVSTTIQTVADIKKYVVEYDIPSLGMNVTNHSAEDRDYIGRNANYDSPEGDKVVSAVISGNEKTYDKTEISPKEFVVMGDAGANRDLFNITYTLKDGDYSGYTTKTVKGSDYQNSDAINAGVYNASISLTDKAIAEGWVLDIEGSITECDLYIKQRPIDIFSHNNDKVYDGTSNGKINNISIDSISDTRGVIGGDTVNLNTTNVSGFYTSDGAKKVIHNSAANSSTGIWKMIRDDNEEAINVLHNDVSDPHHNYYIVNEDYTGAITSRPLYVHSLYQDTDKENNPRNVKTYDGTTDAVVKDILIDNIVDGDDVWVNADSYSGQYEDKEAGEALDENGRPQKDRLNKLVEKKLVLTEKVSLINNEFEDYYIASEEYSGAISREVLTAKVKNWRGIYGTGIKEKPWHDTVPYKTGNKATQGCWLNIDGLVKGDELTLDYDKSGFAVRDVEDSDMTVTESTPVGEYTLSYDGMSEANYPVLKNYIVDLNDGTLTVTPREITVDVNDAEKMEGDKNPPFYSSFHMTADDGSLVELGSDKEKAYSEMKLSGSRDTVENSILVRQQGSDKTEKISLVDGISNIGYWTKCKKDSPAVYLDDSDATLYPCDFCEEYHGFELGTDHQKIGGYEVKINTNPETGATLDVVYVTNPLGEQVQNYTLTYLSGSLQVHPELRLQLEATVPLYVCMYGYNGDGEVIEPTEYGITNYSNKDIRISNINVSKDGWIIKPNKDNLKKGEMHMKMYDTILKLGDNKPHVPSNWKIAKGDKENNKGTFLNLPLTCHIAGGNVNNTEETFISTVTFTITEDR